MSVTVVRIPKPRYDFYAFVVDCEPEYTGRGQHRRLFRIHLTFECIGQSWFNEMYLDRFRHLPAPNRIAQEAKMLQIDMTVGEELFNTIVERSLGRERAHFHQAAWIGLTLTSDREHEGIPVDVYLPVGDDPSTIGTQPAIFGAVERLWRLPSTATTRSLRTFSDEYGLG